MAAKKRKQRHRRGGSKGSGGGARKTSITLRELSPGQFELVPPRCARERRADMEEVYAMLDAGEEEVAIDELRWLLEDCTDFPEAHRLLGELALADGDAQLARGHFGYAYDLCRAALAGKRGIQLAVESAETQVFLEAAKGLVWALSQLGRRHTAAAIARNVLELVPADPLNFAELLTSLDGAPPDPPEEDP